MIYPLGVGANKSLKIIWRSFYTVCLADGLDKYNITHKAEPHSYFGGIFVAIANKNCDKMKR